LILALVLWLSGCEVPISLSDFNSQLPLVARGRL